MPDSPDKKLAGMRTFYRDIQSLETDYQEGGMLRSVLQEQSQSRQREILIKKRRRGGIVWVIVSIVLVVGGFGAMALSERFSTPAPIENGPKLPSLFPVDYNLKLSTTDPDSTQLELTKLATQNYVSPSIVRIVPEDGQILSFRDASAILWPETPLLVSTSVQKNFLLGFYTSKNIRSPFLVLQALNLGSIYEGLGFWEKTLYEDLLVAFNLPSDDNIKTEFRDEFINNIPVRSLYAGTTTEQYEVVRTPVIVTPPIVTTISPVMTTTTTSTMNLPIIANTSTVDFITDDTTSTSPLLETPTTTVEITPAEIIYTEETITTIVPGPETRVLFYTIINGAYIVITDRPETLNEVINRLAKQ